MRLIFLSNFGGGGLLIADDEGGGVGTECFSKNHGSEVRGDEKRYTPFYYIYGDADRSLASIPPHSGKRPHSTSCRWERVSAGSGSDDNGSIAIRKKLKMSGLFRRELRKGRMDWSIIIVVGRLFDPKQSWDRCEDEDIKMALRFLFGREMQTFCVGLNQDCQGQCGGVLPRHQHENLHREFVENVQHRVFGRRGR